MDRIPLINPRLVKALASQAQSTPAPVLKAEVVSSEPASESTASTQKASSHSGIQDQRYKVVLKVGQQQIATISREHFNKGALLEVKVTPGPELKIISSPNDNGQAVNQDSAKAALQQLLADRIPNVQSSGFSKLITQLSSLMPGSNSSATNTPTPNAPTSNAPTPSTSTATKTDSLLAPSSINNNATANKTELLSTAGFKADINIQTAKQVLANLTYLQTATTNNKTSAIAEPLSAPIQQVKNWLQQLPNSKDISNSVGLKNALNNTGIQAEAQLGQLAQQLAKLNKLPQSTRPETTRESSANNIFQHLQKIQQTLFASPSNTDEKVDLAQSIKNIAQQLEQSSQKVLASLTTPQPTSAMALASDKALNETINWQNPLLNNTEYSTLSALLKDPLLQNPSANNKLALAQILNHITNQTDNQVRIPLNWPERHGNDAAFFRTLQNLLGHIEREQTIQLQQSDSATSNNPNPLPTQNQQWLPLLIHHQQQLQLIEFFINQEEKTNPQGEKKTHWFINLHFDLPQLGELGIEISMFENECSTIFWSESTATLSQISHHVQPLRERLTEQGIIVSDVQSRHGTLRKRKHNFEQRLVDIKT